MRVSILAAMLMLSPAVVAAQSDLELLETGAQGRGWQAIGRLDLGGGSFCTGTLIAPDLVLTAAHCLFDRESARLVPVGQVQFLAGWRNGRAEAYRNVRKVMVDPRYRQGDSDDAERVARIASDLGLVQLDMPIRLPSVEPIPIDTPPEAGDAVGVVSYARDHMDVPALQSLCEVLMRDRGALLMNCKADFGASGAPVMAMRGGVPKIVAVVSAKAEQGGKPVSLGALLSDLAGMQAAMATGVAGAGGGATGDTTSRDTSSGGAKFVRP